MFNEQQVIIYSIHYCNYKVATVNNNYLNTSEVVRVVRYFLMDCN